MAVRPITVMGHKALHSKTKKVKEITDDVRTLVADMFDTMEAAEGVGLAANQVGSRLRIFVYDCSHDAPGARGVVINPVLEHSPSKVIGEGWEGCLSVPGEGFATPCAEWSKVTGIDLDGNEVVVVGTGLLARCLQHEVGHLDGHLYLDRLLPNERAEARAAIKERGWEARGVLKWDPSKMKAEDV